MRVAIGDVPRGGNDLTETNEPIGIPTRNGKSIKPYTLEYRTTITADLTLSKYEYIKKKKI